MSPGRRGTLKPFWEDFKAAGKQWTTELCKKNSYSTIFNCLLGERTPLILYCFYSWRRASSYAPRS